MSGFFPSVLFSFKRLIPTPWVFACTGFSAIVQFGKYRGIFGVPSIFLVRTSCLCFTVRIPCRSRCFQLVCQLFRLFLALVPCLYWGISELSKGLPCDCKQCPMKYCPYLLCFLSRDEEGLVEFLPCSLTGLLWWPYFLVFCEGREITIELIEERLVLLFLLIITNLPCHAVTLYWICNVPYDPCQRHWAR